MTHSKGGAHAVHVSFPVAASSASLTVLMVQHPIYYVPWLSKASWWIQYCIVVCMYRIIIKGVSATREKGECNNISDTRVSAKKIPS